MLRKIKDFFVNLFNFGKNIPKALNEAVDPEKRQEKKNLREQLAQENEEKKRIAKLQQDFHEGKIKEEDLSEDDFNTLVKLYEEQIEKTKQEIEECKERILAAGLRHSNS